ncbi:MAG: ribosome small subunit-dependent GTPase A [Lewinellaceae bacterium]|nr:ribosome small subunit-dependent GTPase A [Lewinellaceae bacterium]
MTLENLGYTDELEQFRTAQKLDGFELGRVVAEHKERYVVRTTKGEFDAEITGNMRFTAKGREDFPAVGDWVALAAYDSNFAVIHNIFPRFSILQRQAVGQFGEIQIIATNIDYAFLVQAVDRDFNINRLERYLAICYASKVSPIIVLSKTDLIDEQALDALLEKLKQRIKGVPVIAISNETQAGYETIRKAIKKGKTYCLLGSSGVGKSTLSNKLSGRNVMRTDAISQSTSKGRHVTSHRELIVLENGGILIDNPGMREVGIADASGGLETTFDEILSLAEQCKFKDCTHTSEAGCAVLEAVERGEIEQSSYENYLRLEREKNYFESTVAERRKRDKQFGKIMKNYKKDMKRKDH